MSTTAPRRNAPSITPLERHAAAIRARLQQSGHTAPGPESISWRINREVVVIAGWGRAILLLLAHPSIAAGVRDHSAFRTNLRSGVRRLRSTVRAMLDISFGDMDRKVLAAAGIHVIHDRVQGPIDETTDGAYSAHDPVLQRWVHAALIDSILRVYEALVGPLTGAERDQYCREATIMEPLMGMPSGWLPGNAAQLTTYMNEVVRGDELAVNDTSRRLAHALLSPPLWWILWPVFRALQLLTIGSLPSPLREAYGFRWRPEDARAYERWSGMIRAARRGLPACAREWPGTRQVMISPHGSD